MGSLDWHSNGCIGWYVGRYSIDTWLIHRLAMCRELIQVEHPPMSANILIMILLIAYQQKHIGQIPVNYRQGFRLRPEAGRFVRSFSIPCPVLWFQYLRDFFIIVICVWLSISWIYWLEDNRIFISATLLFFFFCLSSGIFDWFSVSFQRNWSDHFVFIPARPSWNGNLLGRVVQSPIKLTQD